MLLPVLSCSSRRNSPPLRSVRSTDNTFTDTFLLSIVTPAPSYDEVPAVHTRPPAHPPDEWTNHCNTQQTTTRHDSSFVRSTWLAHFATMLMTVASSQVPPMSSNTNRVIKWRN